MTQVGDHILAGVSSTIGGAGLALCVLHSN
jgi:hypothetical protein